MDEFEFLWTVKLGFFRTADEYRQALKKARMCISKHADDILSKPAFTCASQETEMDIVICSVKQLDFVYQTRYSDICIRAQKKGLLLCPNEAGPASRFICNGQLKENCCRVATEEVITDSRGNICTFAIVRTKEEVLLLHYDYAHPGRVYGLNDCFLFARPRNQFLMA